MDPRQFVVRSIAYSFALSPIRAPQRRLPPPFDISDGGVIDTAPYPHIVGGKTGRARALHTIYQTAAPIIVAQRPRKNAKGDIAAELTVQGLVHAAKPARA